MKKLFALFFVALLVCMLALPVSAASNESSVPSCYYYGSIDTDSLFDRELAGTINISITAPFIVDGPILYYDAFEQSFVLLTWEPADVFFSVLPASGVEAYTFTFFPYLNSEFVLYKYEIPFPIDDIGKDLSLTFDSYEVITDLTQSNQLKATVVCCFASEYGGYGAPPPAFATLYSSPLGVRNFMSNIGQILTFAVSWVGNVGSTILQQPLLLAFTALPLCGLGIAVFRRLKNTV